jgi:hypothetical protein
VPQKRKKGPLAGILIALIAVLAAAGVGTYALLNSLQQAPLSGQINNPAPKTSATVPPPDTTSPVISDILVKDVGDGRATVTWMTDEPSTSQVVWHVIGGTTAATPAKGALVTNHFVEISGLKDKSTIYYVVKSADAAGNEAVSEERSFGIGIQPGMARAEIAVHSLSIEDQPATGLHTYVRGFVKNTGDLALGLNNVEVVVEVTVPGKPATGEVIASLDPSPTVINPGETHRFVALVPNGTDPGYTIMARIVNR